MTNEFFFSDYFQHIFLRNRDQPNYIFQNYRQLKTKDFIKEMVIFPQKQEILTPLIYGLARLNLSTFNSPLSL